MKLFKRITALALAAVTAGAMGLSAAADIEETAAEPEELEVYCPTNNDSEFPFNMDIDVYENTIHYIELDEPIYGFERVLDEEALGFDVNFSLKDEYKSFDGYTFTVFNADYSEELASERKNNDETINLTELSLGAGYKISMTLESDSLNAYYGGQFTIQAELDGTLAVDLFYMPAGMDGEAAPLFNENHEEDEKNNNPQTPDSLNHLGLRATTRNDDVDYIRCHIPGWFGDDEEEPYDKGVGTLQLTVTIGGYSIPDFTVEVFDSYGNPVLSNTSYAPSRKELYYRIPNAPLHEIYMIKITSSIDFYAPYILTEKITYGHAWFGQYDSREGDVVYWNTNNLENIKCYDPQKPQTFYYGFKEGVRANTHLFTKACGVVSSAMIFRNLGVTMNGYDIRTEHEGKLQADPFTVMLSNCQYDGFELKGKNIWPNLSNNPYDDYPDKCYRDVIGDKFGLTYVPIPTSAINEASLRSAIADHGYVLIYFDEYTDNKHFMVLTGLTTQSQHFYENATVYDPAASTYATGAGVSLSKTSSGHKYDEINHITSAGYFV